MRSRPTVRAAALAFAALLLAALLPVACNTQHTTAPDTIAAAPLAAAVSAGSPPPIATEPLTGRHTFTDDVVVQIRNRPAGRPNAVVNVADASNLAVLRITVQPGARFPWHTHPGPVLVAVTQGELVYVYADDCVPRGYPQTAFVDPGFGNVHMAYNPSTTTEAVVIATFLGAPAAGPVTLPVSAAEQAALDAKCGVQPAAAHSH